MSLQVPTMFLKRRIYENLFTPFLYISGIWLYKILFVTWCSINKDNDKNTFICYITVIITNDNVYSKFKTTFHNNMIQFTVSNFQICQNTELLQSIMLCLKSMILLIFFLEIAAVNDRNCYQHKKVADYRKKSVMLNGKNNNWKICLVCYEY